VRAALGVDPVFRDRGLAARAEQFTRENVHLIKRIPERLHSDVEALVHHAVSTGRLGEDLAQDIEDRFGVSERHARMIAGDQVKKFYASVNHARQKEMGVNKFIWRTVGDERVRGDPGGKYPKAEPSHFELDGETYDYDDPATPEGDDGEPLMPGSDYNCRCYAEPVLDDEDEDDDDEDDDDGADGDDDDQ
jgi:SPP1 gp7 family putative phage head morphogenesis protein